MTAIKKILKHSKVPIIPVLTWVVDITNKVAISYKSCIKLYNLKLLFLANIY